MDMFKPASKRAGIFTLVIFLVMAGCLCFAWYYHLPKPLVIPLYQELSLCEEDEEDNQLYDTFHLQYVTNVFDTREISYITLDDFPDLELWTNRDYDPVEFESEELSTDYNRQGLYSVRTATICVDGLSKEIIQKTKKPFVITEGTVHYTDESQQKVKLGKIVINQQGGNNTYPESGKGGNINAEEMTFFQLASYIKDRGDQ